VSSESAESSAQVLEALLTNDEVNFTNGVATLVGAYNDRPTGADRVWRWDGAVLRHVTKFCVGVLASREPGDATTYR